ncbi:hypothetical protein JW921_02075 [Candidatus Fermentibacterales bacterium]|nr:hypothetical protein [Candidatus Fermentibacterales bacterium]
MRTHQLLILSVLFLLAAVFSGTATISHDLSGQEQAARESACSGFAAARQALADLLYIQLDHYHHIWMYQGHSWTEATDYLPQIWLIVKLDPGFADVYADGAYHLAVNLDEPERGMELLETGLRNIPDSEELIWQYAFLNHEIEEGSPEAVISGCLDLFRLSRRRDGLEEPMLEKNACILIADALEECTLRANAPRLAQRYDRRGDLLRWLEIGRELAP